LLESWAAVVAPVVEVDRTRPVGYETPRCGSR
jgi:hypothetical protein